MAITLSDRLAGVDWARAANLSGQIASMACVIASVLTLLFDFRSTLFKHLGIFLWTLLSGMLIAVWEVPLIYSTIPGCVRLKNTFLDDLNVRLPIVRTIVYTFLALIIMLGAYETLFVLPGVALFMSALLYAVTALNVQREETHAFDRSSSRSAHPVNMGGEGVFIF